MKRLSLIPILILIISLLTPKAYATDTAITLTGINIENNEISSDTNLVISLILRTPITFSYDPQSLNINGDLQVIYCPEENLSGVSCSFPSSVSNFRIQNIDSFTSENFENYIETIVVMKGKINSGILGRYSLYSVRIAGADLPDRYELHVYTRSKTYAEELTIPRTDIPVPDFSVGDFAIMEPVLELDPVIPEPDPTVEPEPAPEPIATPTPQPVISVVTPQGNSSPPAVNATPIVQSNFYLPAISGDTNWKPLKEISGRFEGWKRIKKNSLNEGRNQVTKTNGSIITFKSEGDALSLRFLGGKKRGSFSIYVNGKFLDRVDANRKKKRALVKTWEDLGKGNHFIDIVAELEPGQSIALNGIHSPRSK